METELLNIKEAKTEYDIHELIRRRWSPRSFADETVAPELARRLFDAARWAPSSYNEQPWRFIYALREDEEEFDRLTKVLNEYNAKWATDAPMLMLTFVKEHFDKNGKPNRVAEYDVGAAMAHLTFEATANDLYVHQMAGILPEMARKLYDIPEGFKPYTMAAIGYMGEPEDLPETFQKSERAERSRLDIDEIAFKGNWKS